MSIGGKAITFTQKKVPSLPAFLVRKSGPSWLQTRLRLHSSEFGHVFERLPVAHHGVVLRCGYQCLAKKKENLLREVEK